MTWAAQAWLLRHGEVVSYTGDRGLTARGVAQAVAAGSALAPQLGDGPVGLRHARSGRATHTAEHVGTALRSAGVALGPAVADPGFDNFHVLIDGRVEDHERMRPWLAERRAAGDAPAHPTPSQAELARFEDIHEGGGDPITWWLTQPTLAFEPAARVVRRFWGALAALAAEGAARTVVCSHSGPMRALAAAALGRDPGEPEHLEAVHVCLAGAEPGAAAELTYRGETARIAVPLLEEPAWP